MPSYPAPVPIPTYSPAFHDLLQAIRSGACPTMPNAPELDIDPSVIATVLKLPTGTHVITAQGHKVV